jgi:hypothetical protein
MLRYVLAGLVAVHVATACSFQFDPVAVVKYYRAEGWSLPGITDFNPKAPIHNLGQYPGAIIPSARATILPHDEDPYIVAFPAQVFTIDGAAKKMRSVQAKATILR